MDANHKAISQALEQIGCTVQSLASVGGGCPDLLVGYHGHNYILEVKDGSKIPSKRKLTDDEAEWQERWTGNCVTVDSPQAAINYVLASGR